MKKSKLTLFTAYKDYLLLVEDPGIQGSDGHFLSFKLGSDKIPDAICKYGEVYTDNADRKIIAHLPLNGAAMLEGVLLLPEIELDCLILLKRLGIGPDSVNYEIHRGKIEQTKNLVLTTGDEAFAKRIVDGYNSLRAAMVGLLEYKHNNPMSGDYATVVDNYVKSKLILPVEFIPAYEVMYHDVYDNPHDGFILRPAERRLKIEKGVLQGTYKF